MEAQCYLPVAILALVRGVAANLCLRTQLKDPQPDHPYTFSGAKTVATFNQLNADLLRCVGGHRATRRPKEQMPPRRTALVAEFQSQNFVLSLSVPTQSERTIIGECWFIGGGSGTALREDILHLGGPYVFLRQLLSHNCLVQLRRMVTGCLRLAELSKPVFNWKMSVRRTSPNS